MDAEAKTHHLESHTSLCWVHLGGTVFCFFDVKNKPERISDVAARNRGVLLDHRTTSGEQSALRGLHVGHKKVEDWPWPISLFNVEAEFTGLKPDEIRTSMGHGETHRGLIEFDGLGPVVGLDNHIA